MKTGLDNLIAESSQILSQHLLGGNICIIANLRSRSSPIFSFIRIIRLCSIKGAGTRVPRLDAQGIHPSVCAIIKSQLNTLRLAAKRAYRTRSQEGKPTKYSVQNVQHTRVCPESVIDSTILNGAPCEKGFVPRGKYQS